MCQIGIIRKKTPEVMYEIQCLSGYGISVGVNEICSCDINVFGLHLCGFINPDMNLHMNNIGIVIILVQCVSVADCEAYLYATAAPVVSRAPVAWVVSLGVSKVFSTGHIVTASVSPFHHTVNGTTVQDNEAVFCLKRKETDYLKWKSISETSLFPVPTAQHI